jgi:hypothetical protein
MADASLGRRVRCFGCAQSFVAAPDEPSIPRSSARPVESDEPPGLPRLRPRLVGEQAEGRPGPLCPRCGRPVSWRVPSCPHCGLELEPDEDALPEPRGRRGGPWMLRRDGEPHRGPLIANLGNLSLIVGCLSLCLVGLGALVSVPVGVTAWLMANRDLELMRTGLMDPQGRRQTENGRTCAILGVVIGLCFAALFAALYFLP